MKKKNKTTLAFGYSLSVISVLAFIAIIGNTWFNFYFLDNIMSGLILVVLGAGLMIEGQIRRWKKMAKGGVSHAEFVHIVTGIIGIMALVVGLFDLVGLTSIKFEAIKGLIASIAIVVIVLQTWFVK